MKAILEFNIPEEYFEHTMAIQGHDWALACTAMIGEVQEAANNEQEYPGYGYLLNRILDIVASYEIEPIDG